MRALYLQATLILVASSSASAQYIIGARDDKAIRADSVFRLIDRTDVPGCALGVYENGTIRYARGYGLANLENSVPMSPRTVLDVGSISKQFTAMAMLMLEKEGKFKLDDPIRKLFPEMPAYAEGVTWRRALSQTSGLRDLWTMWGQTGRSFQGDTVDALNVIYHSAETNYPPGERYLYTNTGWILAAQAVYRLTGKTLNAFAQERIFGPLGMRDTRYLEDRSAIIPNLAESYGPRDKGGWRVTRNNYDGAIQGAGGVHSTVEDFLRWNNNYDSGTVGGPDILATMTTATTLNSGGPATTGPGQAYAVGLIVGTMRGVRVVQHGGAWGGFRAQFYRFPDQKLAVTTFCNYGNAGPDSLAAKVAAIYLGDRMQPDTAAVWTEALRKGAPADLPVATLRGYQGVWRNVEAGEIRRTRVKGDTLFSGTGNPTPLVPLGGGRFRTGTGPAAELRFEPETAPTHLTVRTANSSTTFIRADTVALDKVKLAEYTGDYRSDEVEVIHRWKVEQDSLAVYAGYRRLGALSPQYKDGFTLGGSLVDVVRDKSGRITGYVVQSGRVRNLKFTRVPAKP
ncbi:MAG TPA: serine hydrolase domain-containing protein [Gemmatimonadales bacterium]|nr:serine hydrolase domain-containing protein [Gemmatimonadales bacterium]